MCGLPESFDSYRAFTNKLEQLSQLIKQSRYTVVLTGAGISTSAGIPDFRGPNGIWTREQQRKKLEKENKRVKKKNGRDKNMTEKKSTERSSERLATRAPTKHITGTQSDETNITTPRKRKQDESSLEQTTSTESSASAPTNSVPSAVANKSEKQNSISFETAIPTYTHRSLTHLILQPPPPSNDSNTSNSDASNDESDSNYKTDTIKRTYLHHLVTQNIDGLHGKTHLPRDKISILHGDIFTEICDTCQTEHIRPYEITSIGLKHTGRDCTLGGTPPGNCPGKLKDTLLDWEDELPDKDWYRSQEECAKADLILCLGTSLRIEPAANLCTFAQNEEESPSPKKKGKKNTSNKQNTKLGYVIVNLQKTPYDDDAALVIRGKVDDVMKDLMLRLGYDDWDDVYDYGKSGVQCSK